MQTYEVRLESQNDSQARTVSLAADSPDAAREIAIANELKIVNFSLLPPEREIWERPPGSTKDDPNGLVNLRRWDAYDPVFASDAAALPYEDAVRAAEWRLNDFTSRVDVDSGGKVRSRKLGKHSTARLLAHNQHDPYEIVDVREVTQAELDVAAAGADGMRELVQLARKLHADQDPRWDPAGWSRIFEALREMGAPLNVVTAALHGVQMLTQDSGSSPTVWSSATIAIPLLTSYTANPDTHDFWDDAVAAEIANGSGYTTNGPTLGSKTFTYDTATDQTRGDGADISLTSSSISATDAAIVNRTPSTDATRPLLGSIDFGAAVTTTSGTFAIAFDATGIVVRDYT